MVDFVLDWYKKFISSTNEKDLLVSKIKSLLEGKPHQSCLEIGLGISPYFAQRLSELFKRYLIIERRSLKVDLPDRVKLIQEDWENVKLKEKFDVIIASHVIYYFKDIRRAVEKMFNSLNENGRIFFVVNGKSSDYGPLKLAFSKMIKSEYKFTFDVLFSLLYGKRIREYTLPSIIRFTSYEELFEILRISFDMHPKKYEELKSEIIEYFRENLKGNKFIIDQKIIEVEK